MNNLLFYTHQTVPRPLRASLWDVAFYSLMVGLGETYLSAFVLTMGFSERASGLMITLPTLIGAVIQLAAGFCAQLLGSQKTWVMVSASIQGLALLLLGILSLGISTAPLPREAAVFLLITTYWTFGLAAGPSWSSWIGSIVPSDVRTQFFAYRTRIAQLFTVLGLVAAGLALETESVAQQKLPIFALLFTVGACCRFISVGFLQRHPESLVRPRIESKALFKREFWEWFRARRTFTIIAFLFLTQMATHISGPFFNAYMLKQLSLDYHDYMLLISTAFVARVVAGGVLQRLALRLGSTTLTHLGALLIVPLPILWITTQSLPWLVFFQVLTGFAWGCHELGVTLLMMDKQSHVERGRLLTITQLLNSSAMFLGSWLGYVLLGPGTPPASSYFLLFIVSSCMRFIPVLILPFLGDSRLHRIIKILPLLFLLLHPLQNQSEAFTVEELHKKRLELFDDPRTVRQELEASLKTVSREESPELWIWLHTYAAEGSWFQEDILAARQHVEDTLPFARQQKNFKAAALLTYILGGVYEYDGSYEEAEPHFRKAITIAEGTNDPRMEAYIYIMAGSFYHRHGHNNEAAEVTRKAFALFTQLPQDIVYYDMLSTIGTFYAQTIGPKRDEGFRMIEEALTYARKNNMRYEIYWINQALNTINKENRLFEPIEDRLNENLAYAESLGYQNYSASTRLERGRVRINQYRFEEARDDLEKARAYYLKNGANFYDINILADLGLVYVELKRFDLMPQLLKEFGGALKTTNSNLQKQVVNLVLRRYYRAIHQDDKELAVLRELVDLMEKTSEDKTAEELGRLTRDMEVQRQQFLNDKLTSENKRQERLQRLMLGVLALGGLALAASTVALRRGREIKLQRANLKLILDNIEEGILRFGSDLRVHGEYSLYTSGLLQRADALHGQSIWDLFFARVHRGAEDKQIWSESLKVIFGESRLGWELNEGNLPRELEFEGRILALGWQPLADAEGLTQTILLLIRDITVQVAMEKEAKVAQDRVSKIADRIEAIARGRPHRIAQFLLEAEKTLVPLHHTISMHENYSDVQRMLHTIKGAARSLGLKDISEIVHGFEDLVQARELDSEAFAAQMQALENSLEGYRDLLPHLNMMTSAEAVENLWDIAGKLMPEAQQRLATRFPTEGRFRIVDEFAQWDRVDARSLHDMLLHALTNSIDHGFLLPHARGERMSETPTLSLEARLQEKQLEISLRDNGFGIDWEKLQELAAQQKFTPAPVAR